VGDPICLMLRRSRHALAGCGSQRHHQKHQTDAANDYRVKEEPVAAEAAHAAWEREIRESCLVCARHFSTGKRVSNQVAEFRAEILTDFSICMGRRRIA
jgi:hypothetical protein